MSFVAEQRLTFKLISQSTVEQPMMCEYANSVHYLCVTQDSGFQLNCVPPVEVFPISTYSERVNMQTYYLHTQIVSRVQGVKRRWHRPYDLVFIPPCGRV